LKKKILFYRKIIIIKKINSNSLFGKIPVNKKRKETVKTEIN